LSSTIGAFFGAIFAASLGDLFFLAIDFGARAPGCRTLDFLFFGLMGLAAFLTLTLPRFALFLRVASRFLALAMAIPREHAAGKRIKAGQPSEHYLSAIRHATFIVGD
jgi:hypothetical protein